MLLYLVRYLSKDNKRKGKLRYYFDNYLYNENNFNHVTTKNTVYTVVLDLPKTVQYRNMYKYSNMYIYIYIYIWMYIHLFIHLFIYTSIYLSIYLSISIYIPSCARSNVQKRSGEIGGFYGTKDPFSTVKCA